jgi:hypothetical protein
MIFQRCRHIDIDIDINTDIDMDIYIDIKIDCTPRDLKLEDRICQKKKFDDRALQESRQTASAGLPILFNEDACVLEVKLENR